MSILGGIFGNGEGILRDFVVTMTGNKASRFPRELPMDAEGKGVYSFFTPDSA